MMGYVAPVARLVTFVDVDDDVADVRRMSVSARHEAVLVDGRRVLLLDDRGWSTSGPANIWAVTSVQDIVDTARMTSGDQMSETDGPSGWEHVEHIIGVSIPRSSQAPTPRTAPKSFLARQQ